MDNKVISPVARCRLRIALLALPALVLGLAVSRAAAQQSVEGQWVTPVGGYDWELAAVDAAMLSTGKVIVWDHAGSVVKLWNPTDGSFTDATCGVCVGSLHCPGHAFLTDGCLLAAGGGTSTVPLDETRIFQLTGQGGWAGARPMHYKRFYPTSTTLPDGRILTVAGTDPIFEDPENPDGTVLTPEIYSPGMNTWDELTNPEAQTVGISDFYPFMFVLPTGKIFDAGGGTPTSAVQTHILDLQSNPVTWTEFPTNSNSFFGGRKGFAVMYEPGKVLKCGGVRNAAPPGDPPQISTIDQTAIIDTTAPTPVWQSVGAWNLPEVRRDHNLVLLPDGKILLVGGYNSNDGFIRDARMWDPDAQTLEWKNMADMEKKRGHHSVALLLPDATVLSAGGVKQGTGSNPTPDAETGEIYRPAYLYTGTDPPAISSAPGSVEYGTQFNVTATPIGDIARVTLIRPGSPTHWFDSDQRFIKLGFSVDAGKLLVNAPCSGNFAPPGYYMLFVIDNAGVPSVATWIQVVPNPCRPDLNDDNEVDPVDLAMLLGAWGPCPQPPDPCPADFDCDGEVGAADLAVLLAAWGPCGRGISSGTELIDALLQMGYANVAEHTAWSTAALPAEALASGQQLLELLGQ